jgi:YidC/Oxa1 family membrane protein insertase
MSSRKGLDKNSIIGLVLIGAILLIFSWITKPTDEEVAALEKAKTEQVEKAKETQLIENETEKINNSHVNDSSLVDKKDSLINLNFLAKYGSFSDAAKGEKKNYTIENEKIKLTISNKSGRVSSVELKNFNTYDSLPLILFNEDSSYFNLSLTLNEETGSNVISTENLYFQTTDQSFIINGEDSKSFSLRLYQNNSKNKYIEYKYTLTGNSYLVDFDINTVGLKDNLSRGFAMYLDWNMFTPSQEKTIKNQQQKSTIYYKYNTGDIDYISAMKYEEEKMEVPVDWIMFKQQYFNATLIAKNEPFKSDTKLKTIEIEEGTSSNYVQGMDASIAIPYNGDANETFAMQYYFGPNRFEDLKATGIGLEETLDYGWAIFGWVNMFLIRPVFDFLNGFNLSIGIIILLLTLIIKSILFPITWKTYVSSAKMRVLKPEIAELTEKFKNDKMKKQQATMALYRQTGVNPMAGCIPMLIQMPILFALFRFFPATFDLRQKSFLWAEDLSTYDSIYDLGFDIPMYGDHISLFTLMMAISMIFYTKVNSQMTTGMGGDDGGMMASQMKIMTYLMPVMMLFFFNSYAAGLSLYYLIANIITIGQQFAIRKWIVDEDKLHAKLQANKTKKKKKSGFAAKLEQRMKDAQTLQEKKKKKK